LPSLSLELATADINGDGKPDLVVNGYCGLNVMLNRTPKHGDVAFEAPVPVVDATGQPLHPQCVAIADVNRDGRIDLIVSENNYSANGGESSALDLFLNQTTSSPSFRLAQQLPIGKRVPSVVAADFDQDGWPDLVIVDDVDGTLTFLLNDGQWKSKGGFAIRSSFTAGPQQLLVIDSTGGGLPRLLVRNKDLAAIVQ
jgi:FG-GAP-like repeat